MQPQTYTVGASARIDAPPSRIYGLIADYHTGHPSIVPKQFSNMRVEAGGVGAGTIIRFDLTVLGRRQSFRGIVSEPEPGRVLIEKYTEPNESETTFIVHPEDSGRAATVTIETVMRRRPGLAGAIERFITRRVLPPMYDEELQLLAKRAGAPLKNGV
jgi:hypothetical protein